MAINVSNLTVRAESRAILRSVSFAANDRAITLVVGRAGSGKSTLLRALAGLIRPTEGMIEYGGRPLWAGKRPDRSLLLQIALAFQFPEHQLFAATVKGEFDYSLRPYRLPKAERLQRMTAALEEQRLPASIASHPPFLLSGGQKRRVALATIMAAKTSWLLLDEPSAGLDATSLRQLTEELTAWKRRCGIVLATHDLDAFLPIADRVIVVRNGEVAAEVTPEELAVDPSPLTESGIGLTEAMQVSTALRRAGLPVPPGEFNAERLAARIAKLAHAGNTHAGNAHAGTAHAGNAVAGAPEAESTTDGDGPLVPAHRAKTDASVETEAGVEARIETDAEAETDAKTGVGAEETARGFLYRADAKRKWLAYTLVSLGIIMQTGWFGLAAALLFAIACVSALTATDRRKLLRLSKPLALFMAITVGFSGVTFGASLGFSFETALETFRRLFAFFEITAVGLVFTLSTGTAEMKTGLERGLRPLKRIGLPVEALALAASLVLRFIPLILDEADRFAAIARSRGKRRTKPGQVHLLDIPVFVVPLLTALFQAVEELIFAMELKGFMQPERRMSAERSAPVRPADFRRDRRIVLAGGSMFLLLALIRILGEGPS